MRLLAIGWARVHVSVRQAEPTSAPEAQALRTRLAKKLSNGTFRGGVTVPHSFRGMLLSD